MNTSDAGSPRRIDISLARALPRPGEKGGPVLLKMTDEQEARFDEMAQLAEPDPAERAKGLEQQRKIKAHTIFTVGDKVVAMQWANGWTDVRQGGYAASDMSNIEGADRRAAYIEKTLRKVYGGQLTVHDFSNDPSAPTSGDLEPVIQYKKTLREVLSTRSGGTGSTNLLLALTGTTMSILQGRSR